MTIIIGIGLTRSMNELGQLLPGRYHTPADVFSPRLLKLSRDHSRNQQGVSLIKTNTSTTLEHEHLQVANLTLERNFS